MRQRISDTATGMFLERGFDEVRVAEVAAACGVSEKTVYNYFPTKESLMLDREDGMAEAIRLALGPGDPTRSPIDAVVGVITEDLNAMFDHWDDGADDDFRAMLGGFSRMIESTPSLRAAQLDMMERLLQVAAEAMAERAGIDPDDPEPQAAAGAIMGLWRIEYRGMVRYADGVRGPAEVREAVLADIHRAARLIDTGLWSFNMEVQGASSRQQLRDAADAANEARKQVVAALKQARDAWKQVKDEVKAAHHAHDEWEHRGGRGRQRSRLHDQVKAEQERQKAQREAAKQRGGGGSGTAEGPPRDGDRAGQGRSGAAEGPAGGRSRAGQSGPGAPAGRAGRGRRPPGGRPAAASGRPQAPERRRSRGRSQPSIGGRVGRCTCAPTVGTGSRPPPSRCGPRCWRWIAIRRGGRGCGSSRRRSWQWVRSGGASSNHRCRTRCGSRSRSRRWWRRSSCGPPSTATSRVTRGWSSPSRPREAPWPGCVADLEPAHLAFKAIGMAAGPIVRLAHDWVLDTGARQFRERALPGMD